MVSLGSIIQDYNYIFSTLSSRYTNKFGCIGKNHVSERQISLLSIDLKKQNKKRNMICFGWIRSWNVQSFQTSSVWCKCKFYQYLTFLTAHRCTSTICECILPPLKMLSNMTPSSTKTNFQNQENPASEILDKSVVYSFSFFSQTFYI